MFFTIKNTFNLDITSARAFIKRRAIKNLLLHKWTPEDEILDTFLLKNFKYALIPFCKKLIKDMHIYSGKDEFIIKFADTEAENLATFITYGNNLIKGSSILQDAFGAHK